MADRPTPPRGSGGAPRIIRGHTSPPEPQGRKAEKGEKRSRRDRQSKSEAAKTADQKKGANRTAWIKLQAHYTFYLVITGVFAVASFFKRWLLVKPVNLLSRPKWARSGVKRLPPDPGQGPREWLYRWSEGRWNFGKSVSRRVRYASSVITARRLPRGIVHAVVAFGGGLGKTTNAVLIALKLRNKWPGQAILVIDMNTSPGTLANRLNVSRNDIQAYVDGEYDKVCWTFEDVWRCMNKEKDRLDDVPDINYSFALNREHGLYVLAGHIPTDEDVDRFAGVDFTAVMEWLKSRFVFVVLDCGTDPWNRVAQEALKTADSLTVTTTTSYDRLEQAADFIATMQQPRYQHQRDKIVLVLNKVLFNVWYRGTDRAVDTIQRFLREKYQLEPFEGPVATMPWSPHLIHGRSVRPSHLMGRMQAHALEVTAANTQVVFDGVDAEKRAAADPQHGFSGHAEKTLTGSSGSRRQTTSDPRPRAA